MLSHHQRKAAHAAVCSRPGVHGLAQHCLGRLCGRSCLVPVANKCSTVSNVQFIYLVPETGLLAVSSNYIVTGCMHLLEAHVLCACVSTYGHRSTSHHKTGTTVLCLAARAGSSDACACVHGQACLHTGPLYEPGTDFSTHVNEPCSLTLHQSTVVLVTTSHDLSVAQLLSRNRSCAPCKCNAIVKC